MDFEQARFNMVEQQIRPWEVLDPEVLDTLMTVQRERFVPEAFRNLAFADIAVPLPGGAAMLEPKLEAKVLQAVAPKKTDKVLEIGAGSGYMAALLAARADWVRSIEIDPALASLAAANLAAAGIENVIVEEGDGAAGWPERGPYDVIVVSAGVTEVPKAMLEQLKPGGRLFAFVGSAPVMVGQLITCTGEGQYSTENVFDTLVPALRVPAKSAFNF
ncbi:MULTISPECIES: protein-L-isoaspartate O-methyltransferase family protein [Niveibacterium]|uniref:Protein-L-isoaspartate O-methyltransferase n=1 Tax=Niveibacterium microcysteis TaxID=2811415 RepID=A0ABX7M366_9RHOO|nr:MULTISPECIES: protein-L-isoaspartate O-methyltransferase [Niveibacterium]QSI76205.1 protein-L-isoaspartate O-methyltransferase [Niveibacterium microcysteis]